MADYLTGALQDQSKRRLDEVNSLSATKDQSVAHARARVEAMLGFEAYTHHLLAAIHAPARGAREHAQVHKHE